MKLSEMVTGLDHVAVVVPDTEAALLVWRDALGFAVRVSEVVNDGAVRLTHLSLGNVDLQLVEPLSADHPLRAWLIQHGSGLHHLCFAVDDVGLTLEQVRAAGLAPGSVAPHQGVGGKRALFLDRAATADVQLEVTGA